MNDQLYSLESWTHRPNLEARQGFDLGLPNMRVSRDEGRRLRGALVAAHVELELTAEGPAIHEGLVAAVRDHLAGRSALVWQDRNRFKISFGAFDHGERDDVVDLAERLAHALGARVVFAATSGMETPGEHQSPSLVLLAPGVSDPE